MDHSESREYVKEHLEMLFDKNQVSYPYGRYRGYSTGTTYFKKKDNSTFNEVDLEALKKWSTDRFSSVIGKPGDLEVRVNWTHDSTD